MMFVHKSTLLGHTACWICLAAVLTIFPLRAESQDSLPFLLTSFEIGKLASKVAITGTLVNPRNFELRFEALNHLLSFFDIQEKIDHQLEFLKSKSGHCGMPEEIEGYSDLATMQVLLENVIQDSCNYINWTLSDFFDDHAAPHGCGGLIPMQQSFTCSQDAAQQLKLKLNFWKLNGDLSHNLSVNRCYRSQGCHQLNRMKWVDELNLNASDPTESDVKRYLSCII